MPFEFEKLGIPEVILIKPKVFSDQRGFYMETYKASDFKKNGIPDNFIQDNHSKSKKGIIRGLHYQTDPKAQGKLIRVVKGSVFDVAVDLRKNSPYYGKWISAVLSADNKNMLWIPPGFAHGFLSLEEDSELLYKTTEEYSPEHEAGIKWNDPDISIEWPKIKHKVSEKDSKLPSFKDAKNNFIYEEVKK